LRVFARDLLVAAGEQEDFHSFFAPQQPGAAFGNLTVSLSKKGHLLGHSPHPGGLFWRAAEADGLRAVFLLLACCYQEAPRITAPEGNDKYRGDMLMLIPLAFRRSV